ncbi:hypothetical protein PRUPE_3G104800 [Prunus persica]|uniref:Uncharacterized protein n=1 Tax=Prunus persica TaxID=3760 RepID=A0A251PYH1_PRUPE|nr:hypothetical protein PRUPE_3G104800 [Prunus persica]
MITTKRQQQYVLIIWANEIFQDQDRKHNRIYRHQYPMTDVKDERITTRCPMASKSDERELWTVMWKHII